MKKRIWNILAIVLIVSMGAAACRQATPEPTATPKPAATATPVPPTKAPVVEYEDEWGVVKVEKGDTIKIGFAAALTGAGVDVLGLDELRGTELAVKDKPEIMGFEVELVVDDEMCSAEGGQTVANKFVADPQIVALVGHMCSSSCLPSSKIYEQYHYSMVSPSCTGISLTVPDADATEVFNRVCWSDKIQGPAAAEFVLNVLGVDKVATIHDGSPYAEQLQAMFAQAFEEMGGQIVGREAVNVGDTDMRPVLTRLKAGDPELIYAPIFPAEAGYLASQRPDVGMEDVIFMGADGIKADVFIEAAGDLAEGVYASAGDFAEAGPALPAFREAYEAEYGEAPIAPFHAHAYDAYMVIANAIEKVAEVDADGNLFVGRKKLRDAIRATTGYQGLSGKISCDENGDCGSGSVSFSMVKGGEWVAAEVPAAAEDLLDIIMEKGVMVGASDPNYAPQSFLNDAGEMVGFDIDVYNEVAKRLGVELELVTPDWDLITAGSWGARWDISIGSMTPTEERGKVLWFTDPYYYTPAGFAVHTDNTTITTVDDLAGKVIGCCGECTYERFMEKDLAIPIAGYEVKFVDWEPGELRTYPTDANAIEDLRLGDGVRLDAVMSAVPTLQNAIKEGVPIKLVGDPVFYEPLSFALDKSRGPSEKLLAKLNEILAAMHSDGTLTELSMKWYDKDITKPTPVKAAAGEPLIIGTTDSVTDLDPANSYDFHTWEIHHNTMDTLLHYVPGTTDLEPALATEMPEVSNDGLEYTFKLREGLTFPDGVAFNADAVVWSINRVMRLEGDPSWLVTSFVDHVEKVDEYTVKFVIKNAVSFFPKVVATEPYAIVSPECYPEDDFDVDSTCGGIGPYKIKSWERDVEMELVANPDYWDPPAHSSVVVRYFADATAMRLALEAGDIDVAWKTLTPSDYNDLRDNPDYNFFEAGGPYIRYICFNCTTEPFDNPKVRQAISLAIDRNQISDVVFQGTHDNLYSMVPMGMFSHVDAFPERDVEQAKSLLAEAGFDASNPLEMDLWWTPSHYGPTEGDVASALKQALEETGAINVSLQSAEWATYTDYFGPGTMPVFLLGWYPDYLDPDNYTSAFAECDASEDLGIFYCSEEMDDLLIGARTSTDPAEREQMYKELQDLWTTEVPTIPFTQGLLMVVTQKDVSGVVLDPTLFLHYFTITK